MPPTLTLTDVADESVRQAILAPLRQYNVAQTGLDDSRPLTIAVRDDEGTVIGGLWGWTSFEWLFIQLLVVPEATRGQGLGRELMRMAEAEARARGCRGAWLDTFEFQARGFYEGLGYAVFGSIPDYPPGFSRFFMRKSLEA
jgi:GNAT superfamily N-acetyltransferase